MRNAVTAHATFKRESRAVDEELDDGSVPKPKPKPKKRQSQLSVSGVDPSAQLPPPNEDGAS